MADLPPQLAGDPRRQAVDSTSGDVYQAWWSIDAWLRLVDADQVVYLEGAEDFDIVKNNSAVTVQVKRNTGTISLGTAKALKALENFWTLSNKESHRSIEFHYLTTSSIAMEQDGDFGGAKGIEAWRAAQTNIDLTVTVANYLFPKLDEGSPLRLFLGTAEPLQVQERLIKRFHWLTDQPDINTVKLSVNNRIAVLLDHQRHPISLVSNVRKYLESRFWEIILEPSSANRCLTRGELLRQVEEATTACMRIPINQLPELFTKIKPGWDLLKLLLQKTVQPPKPLLQRSALTHRLEELVKHRKVILLTGTVHKGKTTVAQLVSSALCPEAWWVKVTGLTPSQVDMVLLALANRIESGDCPSVVVIDDLDISPISHCVYRDSLALVLHRATTTGRGVILTAQGGSSESAVVQDFDNAEILEVPELSMVETKALCIEHGCPDSTAEIWGTFIAGLTRGHPKLVQVRVAELAANGWPDPVANDFMAQSSAVISTRQMARLMLCNSAPAPVAEFVYLVSECSVPMHRSVAIRLAEKIEGLTNGGDVIDNLAGKWLERIDCDYYRSTALLNGVASDVWSSEKRKWAHTQLHDAILAKHILDPSEAAALLTHAFFGGDKRRIARTAMRLQLIQEENAKKEVERQLLWLPFVALEAGQSITGDPFSGAILRAVQFRVASTLDSDSLPKICIRWAEEIERIEFPEAKAANLSMMWLSTIFVESLKIPLKCRLEAILGICSLPSDVLKSTTDLSAEQFFLSVNALDGLPNSGTTAQAMLFSLPASVRDFDSISELLQWLDSAATEEIRQQFDEMLEWPLIQELGAFVLGAFAAIHESTLNWEPWLDFLQKADEYAIRRQSPRFGREVAKTKAILLTEYLSRSEEALEVLDQAEAAFGTSPVLMEQRANLMFQTNDDESMLEVWSRLTNDPTNRAVLDPFAYRRAGISASRLKQWEKAGEMFLAGASSVQPGSLELTRFGLCVDAALAISHGGDQATAAKILADAVLSLPPEAAADDDAHWEALQRLVVSLCSSIEDAIWKQTELIPPFKSGYASMPGLKFTKGDTGQAARSEITRVEILRLVSTLRKAPAGVAQALEVLAGSRYVYVRWQAAEARLSLSLSTGAGDGFIEKILCFDRAISELSKNKKEMVSLLEPDSGSSLSLPSAPQRWFGLLCAGVICSGSELIDHLKIWKDDSMQLLGEGAALTEQIRLLLKGASQPPRFLTNTINDPMSSMQERYGAVAQLLCNSLQAKNTLQAQALLTSGLMRDDIYARQQIFNRHVARCFADVWREHAQNRFQFCSPGASVPALLTTLDEIEYGCATLKKLFIAASRALREPLGPFMERVL